MGLLASNLHYCYALLILMNMEVVHADGNVDVAQSIHCHACFVRLARY